MKPSFVLKGIFLHTPTPGVLETLDGWALCREGVCAGLSPALPDDWNTLPLVDCSGCLVLPGMTDLHLHAPQAVNRGLGGDLELLDWLERYTFPEEARFAELAYGDAVYAPLATELRHGFTTRACLFSSVHVPATLRLMELLEETGLVTLVGKVSMDRNCSDSIRERSVEAAVAAVRDWLSACAGRFSRTGAIVTPRFVPSCTGELMAALGRLATQKNLPVQSHLSENRSEIDWVAELHPEQGGYAEVYDAFGLLNDRTIQAHCVYSDEAERALLKARGVTVAHCPTSNSNLRSGIAPVRAMLREGLKVGLGSDIAGGYTLSMPTVMAEAVAVSKLRWRLVDEAEAPLSLSEAFYLATKGGGAFFGKVGSFEEGYDFDAVVVDDRTLDAGRTLTPSERLERLPMRVTERHIVDKYVAGRKIALEKQP